MGKINVFNFVTLNGFYKGPDNDISWHQHAGGGSEENEYSEEGANSGGMLLFGRVTYEMMAGFWPTPMAAKQFPKVAEGMNNAEKIVFSKTLKKADWNHTRIISTDILREVRKLKEGTDKTMTILGSGSIVSLFTDHGLIDVYQLMVDPIAIGEGTSIFHGIKNQLNLELVSHRKFESGIMLLSYKPKK